MMQKIVGIGNSLTDILARVDETTLAEMNLPKGSMQLIDETGFAAMNERMATLPHEQAAGGSAANTIKALAALGVATAFVGRTADDVYGRFFREALENAGCETRLTVEPTGRSGVASTFITTDGQRTFATYLGASAHLSADDITPASLTGGKTLYIEGYLVTNHALMERVCALAKEVGMDVCLDLASYNVVEADRDFFVHMVRDYVDIVFANEEEAQAFTGKAATQAAGEIGKWCRVAVVKLGAKGACAYAEGAMAQVEAEPCDNVVDTTGAGDFFAAGFLKGYTAGRPIAECLKMGGTLSAAVIRQTGTELDAATWQTLREKTA